ncbi:MAG: tRNA (cytidine(34)-2'-O)-methyltransferase [Hyphomicrobiales bacterium]|nr:tRNA (cytidine(34)-2'-O)-methyltransferase [Hyphomicrobiales bacterium]
MRLALFQPDIPQNTGTILRMATCFDLPVDIIEPCGFAFSDRRLKRAGLDYLQRAQICRYPSWQDFRKTISTRARLVLLTTKSDIGYTQVEYLDGDVLLVGSETAGVPPEIHEQADVRVRIPTARDCRSLNVAVACAIVAGEALRQTGRFCA